MWFCQYVLDPTPANLGETLGGVGGHHVVLRLDGLTALNEACSLLAEAGGPVLYSPQGPGGHPPNVDRGAVGRAVAGQLCPARGYDFVRIFLNCQVQLR